LKGWGRGYLFFEENNPLLYSIALSLWGSRTSDCRRKLGGLKRRGKERLDLHHLGGEGKVKIFGKWKRVPHIR